ncbi:MAG: phosphotransferase [Alphaproteobacteria bacterium]|nr:phosphotransferase [Alphaproteobacteria bacterium]
MSERKAAIDAFLHKSGWGNAERHPLPGDASTRRYIRIVDRDRTAMLMDQPQGAETAACPPDASEQERRVLGYNAVARLAGPDTRRFAGLATHLKRQGLSAPEIIAHDYDEGFLLIEDFGDGRFADLMAGGYAEQPFYENAIDALIHLHQSAAPAALEVPGANALPLLAYDAMAMEIEVDLLADWFYPAASGRKMSTDQRAEYLALWRTAFAKLDLSKPVLVLRDYHAENLMWLDDRAGVARSGLLDFQDALAGSPAYDVVSLIEDARREVSPELASQMAARYVAGRKTRDASFDVDQFKLAAALLAAQRNTKIVGIFSRLWKRDGKPRYTSYLPRMWRYLDRDLQHPELSALKSWFDRSVPRDWRGALTGEA